MKLYLMDVYTVIANLGGYPALSVPVGAIVDDGVLMPVGCQLMSKRWDEAMLFRVGSCLEKF
jgi:aspartyl-tRNA(Asn)/glutamyl-tRNA(Gln) amidotransferase subunit A